MKINGEISSYDEDGALFVKLFEIYAIIIDSYTLNKNLRVAVIPAWSAPIYPVSGQVKYELRPRSRTKYVFEYKEDCIGNCGSKTNPYLVCFSGPKDICVQSRGSLAMTYVLTPPSTVLGLCNLTKKSATPLDLLQKRNCFSKLQ